MMTKILDVYISGVHAGSLIQGSSGALSFEYLREYRGVALSSAMPLSTRRYYDKIIQPYLWGLLPEDQAVRRRVASKANISPNNPFALLGVIGLDCPGAVQFCPHGINLTRDERLVAISNTEIAQRLSQENGDGSDWIADNEHWSLGGQQNKFALRRIDDKWYSCEGAAATTHILKTIPSYSLPMADIG